MRKIGIELALPENTKINSNMGSVFHGLLMELLDSEEASRLHDASAIRPYSQYVYYDMDYQVPVWCINILDDSIEKRVLPYVLENVGIPVQLVQKGYSIIMKGIIYDKRIDYDLMADEIFLADKANRTVNIDFLTVVSFKKNGRFVVMPELYLIFKSLINKWNTFSVNNKIEEDDLAKSLAEMCEIYKYRLSSKTYSVDGKNIYGFAGEMSLRIHGNDMVKRIITLLLNFAEYSGIGVKTALGMGAVKVS